jgi:hypothetical protein
MAVNVTAEHMDSVHRDVDSEGGEMEDCTAAEESDAESTGETAFLSLTDDNQGARCNQCGKLVTLPLWVCLTCTCEYRTH